MQYRTLGTTDLKVSSICLGTMTWGNQNTEAEAHEQLDYALNEGVNFIDTAESYPIPPSEETQGDTERFIGTWIASRGNREKFILASKVAGRSKERAYIRGEELRLNKKHITLALEASLSRLKTDYLDLYQLHWPERKTNFFGALGYTHDPEDDAIELQETLEVLKEIVASGKVRYVGVSNETPWGVMHALELAQVHNLPRIQSIQNPYHLLNRTYEIGLSEISIREQVSLLAYSPLAMGVLSGKYLDGVLPAGSRFALSERNSARYNPPRAQDSIRAYVALAEKHGLDPAQMALAFVHGRDFVTSTIIGAATMAQLKSDIAAADVTLSPDVLAEIDAIHHQAPNLAW